MPNNHLIPRKQGPAKAIFFGGNNNEHRNPVCSLVLESDLIAAERELQDLREANQRLTTKVSGAIRALTGRE